MCDEGCFLNPVLEKPVCELWLGSTEAEPATAADAVLCHVVPQTFFQLVLLDGFLTQKHAVSFPTPLSCSTFSPSTPLQCVNTPLWQPLRPAAPGISWNTRVRQSKRILPVCVRACVCVCVCVFVDTVCEYTSCAPGLLFSSFAKGLKSAWMIYFRMCKVLGIIIFSEIKKSIKAVSCPRAEIVALWMHVLCPVNMICGLCFKVLPASFFFAWLSSLFKAGGPKYLNSN